MAKLKKMKFRIGVLGTGAIGGLLAGLFCKEGHDVFCIARPATVSKVKQQGLYIESSVFGNFVANPSIDEKLTVPLDILFITLKYPFLNEALENIDPKLVNNTIIIPLLNGVGHREIIRSHFGEHAAAGMIGMIEVVKNPDGVIQHLSKQKPHIDFASDSEIINESLKDIAEAISKTGISISILKNESDVIWKKLVRLSAIASTTAAFQETVGAVRSDPVKRKVLEDIINEGALVAQHEGVEIKPKDVVKQVDLLPETLMTSLQRDVKAHRPSEVESITGGVLNLAKTYNIPAPAHAYTYKIIKSLSSV